MLQDPAHKKPCVRLFHFFLLFFSSLFLFLCFSLPKLMAPPSLGPERDDHDTILWSVLCPTRHRAALDDSPPPHLLSTALHMPRETGGHESATTRPSFFAFGDRQQ